MKIDQMLKERPTISFEIFPPKKYSGDLDSIYNTIDALAHLKPDFISVTYGAGGSSKRKTVEIASKIKQNYGIEAVAHLSGISSSKQDILTICDELKANNIENILALRGDEPLDGEIHVSDFCYASELNYFIKEHYGDTFCLSGACYPEVHQEAESFEEDLKHLEEKVNSGAKYLITQIFFDNHYYYRLVKEARKRGITVPIIAGIMPVTNAKSLLHTAKLCGSNIPYELSTMIEQFRDNPKAMREIGANYATRQIIDLITNGVDGIHIYTMNKPKIAQSIFEAIPEVLNGFRQGTGH